MFFFFCSHPLSVPLLCPHTSPQPIFLPLSPSSTLIFPLPLNLQLDDDELPHPHHSLHHHTHRHSPHPHQNVSSDIQGSPNPNTAVVTIIADPPPPPPVSDSLMPEPKKMKLTPSLPSVMSKPPVIAGLMGNCSSNGGISHNSQSLSRSEVDAVKQLITGKWTSLLYASDQVPQTYLAAVHVVSLLCLGSPDHLWVYQAKEGTARGMRRTRSRFYWILRLVML